MRVDVTEALGSTPRERGAWMLVSDAGLFGTIGGGQLEMMAITRARELLGSGERSGTMDVPLGPEIGQCCGGRVALALGVLDAGGVTAVTEAVQREEAALPQVHVFGAGHVGKALAEALSRLPVRTLLVETRQDELDAGERRCRQAAGGAAGKPGSRDAAPGAAFVVLTHDHALDFLIVREALGRAATPPMSA